MSENKKDVYKFWLGFFEKLILLLLATIFMPLIIGQFELPAKIVVLISIACLFFLFAIIYISIK
ncbi:MAG: hypothetical protein D6813_09600, partial [Calditrichaeota bacterium]